MVGKTGWLRVVEASISVLLILGAILTIPATYEKSENNRFEEGVQFAVNNLAENLSLRDGILRYNLSEPYNGPNNLAITNGINRSLYSSFGGLRPSIYFKICLANEACSLQVDGSMDSYSIERIIATGITNNYFLPKKIKVVVSEG